MQWRRRTKGGFGGSPPRDGAITPKSDLQQSTLVQLLEQNVLHLQSGTVC